ncbi:MAG: hypothetical protein ACFFDN_36140 [Candidatus Hodarchaeota archaeon]
MVQVIENIDEKGTEWGISFNGNNPEPTKYIKMPDKETAFSVMKQLNNILIDIKDLKIYKYKSVYGDNCMEDEYGIEISPEGNWIKVSDAAALLLRKEK